MNKQKNDDQNEEQNDDLSNGRDDVMEDLPVEDEAEQTAASSDPDSQDLGQLDQDFESLQAQTADLQNQLRRALADYQNLEKRVAEGRSELTTWATGNLIIQLLPAVDNMETALMGMSEEERKSGWAKGVELSLRQMKQVLKDEGLEEIKAEGEFDPVHHEAVDTKEGEDNHILEVVQKGYNLKGKVLRPARVVVGRKDWD